MNRPLGTDARLSIEDRLLQLDGVLHAAVDRRNGDLWIVRDPQHEPGPIELAARNILASSGYDAVDPEIHVSLPVAAGPRRRVRFINAVRAENESGVTVTVSLEWEDVVHSGSATGERGWAVELKTTAQAALLALEAVSGHALGLRIIGVKQLHAFDSTIMVVSIVRAHGTPQRLIGAVIVRDNPLHSAAIAVLSGLNRILGNFLHTPD